jgi:hypothetical protein
VGWKVLFAKHVYLLLIISEIKGREAEKEGHGGRRTTRKRMLIKTKEELFMLSHYSR